MWNRLSILRGDLEDLEIWKIWNHDSLAEDGWKGIRQLLGCGKLSILRGDLEVA